jgi:hypothetical protein
MPNPARRAISRNVSMWQALSAAVNAASGSTASVLDQGAGTTERDAVPGTEIPPSNPIVWTRL